MLDSSKALGPAEAIQFFRIINEQADHMRELLRDLLDAGRIEAGTLAVSPEPATVAGLADRARTTFLGGGGRNPVEIDLPPDLPRVLADKGRVAQILGNLVANASMHSPAAAPIRISAAQDGVYVAVSVSDEGAGVRADLSPHVFRKFAWAGAQGGEREPGGSGLRLAICTGLVEAHGGRLWAESDGPGQRARFTFTLPAVEEPGDIIAAGLPGTGARAPAAGSGRPRVLVVDDDPHALGYVRDALVEAGYDPVLTGDPGEVARLLKSSHPDVVLLDLVLPGVDGIELMAQTPALADVPVILVLGYDREDAITGVVQAGAADYIVKPFSPTELVARIGAALRRRAAPREAYRLGDLAISYEERRARVAGRVVPLTATEFDLLRELAVNAGRVVTHDALLRKLWNLEEGGDTRLVRAFVKKLRRKLGDDADDPSYIFTEPRVGYRMPWPEEQ